MKDLFNHGLLCRYDLLMEFKQDGDLHAIPSKGLEHKL